MNVSHYTLQRAHHTTARRQPRVREAISRIGVNELLTHVHSIRKTAMVRLNLSPLLLRLSPILSYPLLLSSPLLLSLSPLLSPAPSPVRRPAKTCVCLQA